MLKVSSAFMKMLGEEHVFTYTATITFLNGVVKRLTEDDLITDGCSILTSSGSAAFPIGNAICRALTLTFYNPNDEYRDYSFYQARIRIDLQARIDEETTEGLYLGTFVVTEPEEYGSTITLTAYDDFYKADKMFQSDESAYPMSAAELFRLCCYQCGLTPITLSFYNDDYEIQHAPEDMTCRQIIGHIAALAGGNAICEDLGVSILSIDTEFFDKYRNYDGGYFDAETPYESGTSLNGGTFNPWDEGDISENGIFAATMNHLLLDNGVNLTIGTEDIVVTGIRIKDGDDDFLAGTDDYVLTILTALYRGSAEEAATRMGTRLIGLRLRPFTCDHTTLPVAQVGDVCQIYDFRGHYYNTVVTDLDFAFKGFTVIQCSAEPPTRNSAEYIENSSVVQTIRQTRSELKNISNGLSAQIQRLGRLMANSIGMFGTEETMDGGGKVYYFHDHQDLSESVNIWKCDINGFAISNDGGATYKAGFDVDGNAVFNILSAIGINFSWAKGGELSLGGHGNGRGILRVYGENDSLYGMLTNAGLQLLQGANLRTDAYSGGMYKRSLLANGQLVFYYSTKNTFTSADIVMQLTPVTWSKSDGTKTRGLAFASASDRFFTLGTVSTNGIRPILYMNADKAGYYPSFICVDSSYKTEVEILSDISGHKTAITPQSEGFTVDTVLFVTWPAYIVAGLRVFPGNLNSYALRIAGNTYCRGNLTVTGQITDNLYISGNLVVSGSKSRSASTENYSERELYAYETASPYFGDIGIGQTDDNGICYIVFDDIFIETVNTAMGYCVFLQKEGPGDLWVDKKEDAYFVVKGSPNLSFSWEVKVKQLGYETLRCEDHETAKNVTDEVDYETEAADLVANQLSSELKEKEGDVLHVN